MYSITNEIMYNNVDAYVFLFCDDFEENIKQLENKFNKKKSLGLNNYFDDESKKVLKIVKDNKIFFIAKVSDGGCSKKDLDDIIYKVMTMVKNEKKIKKVQILPAPIKKLIEFQVLKFVYYIYEYEKYKTKKTNHLKKVYFCVDNKLKNLAKSGIVKAEILNNSRDMVNEPPNKMTAQKFLNDVRKTMSKKIKLRIYDEATLKKEKMNLILSVNNGSKNKPYLLVLSYLPLKRQDPAVLVGKGVTFDAGGINLKFGNFHDMKTDMTGASVVFSVINLLAKMKVKKNVIALIPLVENMIGQNAARPGDVIVSHSKKTVEITNTDAEGRLIMADCLSFCKKFNPSYIIDVATLTGSVGRMFDNMSTAMMGNNNKMQSLFEKTSDDFNELVWKLPLWKEFNDHLKSKVADLKNSNDRGGQTMVAGSFLSNFVPKDTKWMHLDIAGVSYFENSPKYKGATAASIHPIYDFIKRY